MSEWWILPDGQPRAVVQIIHGMCEHIGRYRMFAEALSGEGYAVYSCDLPGHGSDCPTLGYAPGSMWENTLSQLREACASVRARYPGLPIAVFGHSYGSFLLQRLLPELGADAYILSGSCRQSDSQKLRFLLEKAEALPEAEPAYELAELTFAAYNKPFEQEGKNAWLSRDSQRVSLYNADHLCGFVCSANFYRGLYTGLLGLCDSEFPPAAEKKVPVLVMSVSRDPVGLFGEGVTPLAELYTQRGYAAELRLYEQGRHEMLNELNRSEVVKDVLDFLKRSI